MASTGCTGRAATSIRARESTLASTVDRATSLTTRAARVIAQRLVDADLRADPERGDRPAVPAGRGVAAHPFTDEPRRRARAGAPRGSHREARRPGYSRHSLIDTTTTPISSDEHASIIGSHPQDTPVMSRARTQRDGRQLYSAEHAVEAAALCNPQRGATSGPERPPRRPRPSRRSACAAIGEGHVSSLGFAAAVVGPGANWTFEPRESPAVSASQRAARWARDHLRAVLADEGQADELTHSVLAGLPDVFTASERATNTHRRAPRSCSPVQAGMASIEVLRRVMASAYEVSFPADVALSQQVILPATG